MVKLSTSNNSQSASTFKKSLSHTKPPDMRPSLFKANCLPRVALQAWCKAKQSLRQAELVHEKFHIAKYRGKAKSRDRST